MKRNIDFLIVGAGFYGCVIAERIANVLKKNVTDTYKLNRISGSLDITSSSVDGNIRCYQTTKLKAF